MANNPTTISGDFTATASGNISQTVQPLSVTGTTTLNAGAAGNVSLNNASNDFAAVAVPNASGVTLVDDNPISIGHVGSAGNINVTADADVEVLNGVILDAVGTIRLTADDEFPTPPGIGSGGISVDNFAVLDGSGAIRMYGAHRGDNTIAANAGFNGQNFSPGPIFVDSPTEQWGEYSPGGTANAPYTFFYKENGTPTPDPTPTPTAGKDPKCEKLGNKLGTQKRRVRKLRGRAKQAYIAAGEAQLLTSRLSSVYPTEGAAR